MRVRDDESLEETRLDARTAALQAAVRARAGEPCQACAAPLCGHEVVLAVLLGYRDAPHCAHCLARETGETRQALTERVLGWLRARACYRAGWLFASAREASADTLRPECLFARGALAPTAATEPPTPGVAVGLPRLLPHDEAFDAGDMACGELVLALRLRLRALPGGGVLHVIARDPAAPVDLPAWCGLTGHRLLSARHPRYWIERKEDPNP